MKLWPGLALLAAIGVSHAQLPEFGVPVPALAQFDTAMQDYMALNEIQSGVLGVSRFGVVVYQRGFGSSVEENTPMRIASLEKPFTAAAIRMLIADGQLSWNDFVFNLGQANGGLLNHTPYTVLGDLRLGNITVADLVNHQGGWDRATAAIGDAQFYSDEMGQEMGLSGPANRDQMISYMLSQPLQYSPGMNGCTDSNGNPFYCYSNFGYMLLGRIIETVSGISHLDFLRTRVATPQMWVPYGEIIFGRSLFADKHPREPFYQGRANCANIFDPAGPPVWCPYGSWQQEVFVGHGNLVMPVGPLLAYMSRFQVAVQMAAGTPLAPGQFVNGNFNGALEGTSTRMDQATNGINIAVLFTLSNGTNHGAAVSTLIRNIIAAGTITWPTAAVDGYWLDSRVAGNDDHLGSYDRPFRTMTQVLSVGAGTRLRLMPTTTNWTGTISQRMRIDAPLGPARIGG